MTKIEWTEQTWNPIVGCSIVSPGCTNCYAMRMAYRILAGCPDGGTVLDPFGGAGTTGLVASRLQRHAILIEINPDYAAMARQRIDGDAPLLSETIV
jgi:protein gp37